MSYRRPSAIRNSLSSSERRYIDETISAIRLRTRHHDPYEEWEKDTRRDAFARIYSFLLIVTTLTLVAALRSERADPDSTPINRRAGEITTTTSSTHC